MAGHEFILLCGRGPDGLPRVLALRTDGTLPGADEGSGVGSGIGTILADSTIKMACGRGPDGLPRILALNDDGTIPGL